MTAISSTSQHRFYGRTIGKKISPRAQALLTQEAKRFLFKGQKIDETLWPGHVTHRCLEIGFGSGEHMLTRLTQEPHTGFLGIEPFQNGLTKILSKTQGNPGVKERLRLSPVPIQDLWEGLANQFFHEIVVLFPDPWPKKRHHKRRLLQGETLAQIIRVLIIGGCLKIASDDSEYIGFILDHVSAHKELVYESGVRSNDISTWPKWPETWPLTRYGQKALSQNKPLGHLFFRRAP
jgi:tRNA (guanine-N7-)-methyltransferase